METDKKYELGHIYGSRVSKNGRWLNLQVVCKIGEQEYRITCPVKIIDDPSDALDEAKPFARVESALGKYTIANIVNIPIYAETPKKKEEENFDLPF